MQADNPQTTTELEAKVDRLNDALTRQTARVTELMAANRRLLVRVAYLESERNMQNVG